MQEVVRVDRSAKRPGAEHGDGTISRNFAGGNIAAACGDGRERIKDMIPTLPLGLFLI